MAKADWGLKRVCPHCNTRYYDMKKNPPVCPSCGTIFDPETLLKTRRGRITENKKSPNPTSEDDISVLPLADGEDAEDSVIEDADELADDDVDEVIEVSDDDDDDRNR